MKVLLVSGSPTFTALVTTAMTDGDQVTYTEVRRPERALVVLDESVAEGGEPFEIVIADNDTQPAGGFYLAREMKARMRMGVDLPPVLLVIAREQDHYLARWSEADAWVLKPIDPFDLAEAVEALVERRPMPRLPGVWTFEQAGAIVGPGQAGELPQPSSPGTE